MLKKSKLQFNEKFTINYQRLLIDGFEFIHCAKVLCNIQLSVSDISTKWTLKAL